MYLYYSNTCNHCQRLVKTYDFKTFKVVDVQKQQVPNNVKSVPTIIDDSNKTHVGKNAFAFMDDLRSVQPYGFEVSNLNNTGFSFIDKDPSEMFYCENKNYTEIN